MDEQEALRQAGLAQLQKYIAKTNSPKVKKGKKTPKKPETPQDQPHQSPVLPAKDAELKKQPSGSLAVSITPPVNPTPSITNHAKTIGAVSLPVHDPVPLAKPEAVPVNPSPVQTTLPSPRHTPTPLPVVEPPRVEVKKTEPVLMPSPRLNGLADSKKLTTDPLPLQSPLTSSVSPKVVTPLPYSTQTTTATLPTAPILATPTYPSLHSTAPVPTTPLTYTNSTATSTTNGSVSATPAPLTLSMTTAMNTANTKIKMLEQANKGYINENAALLERIRQLEAQLADREKLVSEHERRRSESEKVISETTAMYLAGRKKVEELTEENAKLRKDFSEENAKLKKDLTDENAKVKRELTSENSNLKNDLISMTDKAKILEKQNETLLADAFNMKEEITLYKDTYKSNLDSLQLEYSSTSQKLFLQQSAIDRLITQRKNLTTQLTQEVKKNSVLINANNELKQSLSIQQNVIHSFGMDGRERNKTQNDNTISIPAPSLTVSLKPKFEPNSTKAGSPENPSTISALALSKLPAPNTSHDASTVLESITQPQYTWLSSIPILGRYWSNNNTKLVRKTVEINL